HLTFHARLAHLSKVYKETAGRALIDMLLPDLKSAFSQSSVAIIGARQVPEIDVIGRELSEPRIIGIHAPVTIRFARAGQRRRPDAGATYKDFLRLTFWKYSLGLADLMFRAERILDNSGSEEQFRAVCDELAAKNAPPPGQCPPVL